MSAFKNVKSLRTLLEIYSSDSARKKVPSFSSLRALQIIGAYEFSALADLTHLRYLYIYNSDITALPESLCSLMRLQILKLERCSSLDHLPQHLTRLKDLRHLIIKKCKKLVAMSPSIGKLKCLKTLSIFIVDLKSRFGLEELHDLQLGVAIVVTKLATFVFEEAATYLCVNEQAKKLNGYLSEVHDVLLDAEEQQVTSDAIKRWLKKVIDAAHVLDDILEDSSTKPVESECIGLCGWLTHFHPSNTLYRHKLGQRFKDITSTFDFIHEERRKFEFRPATILIERQPQVEEWRQTTATITEPIVYGRDEDTNQAEDFTNVSSRVHHMSCLSSVTFLDMSAFKNVKSLRTLLEIYSSDSARKKVPSFSSLRALQIIGAYEFSALADLTHLRYLYIYNSDITALPESLCSLMRLQILKLERCSSLDHLPQHLTRLKDLRHLIIKKCKKLVAMSPSIGKLKCLKTLSIFIVDLKSRFGLEELHDLQLGGKLHIRGNNFSYSNT
ncbi:unnamed protein product [Lupinus luteus]